MNFGESNFNTKYVNSGVLLFNLKRIRENFIEPNFWESATKYSHPYHDQDVLNIVCYDQILKLPTTYNMASFFCNPERQAIIHYIVAPKPWSNPRRRLADIWWDYANKTDYYTEINAWSAQLRANIESQAKHAKTERKPTTKQLKNTHKFKLRRAA